jgi:hypothetical protein
MRNPRRRTDWSTFRQTPHSYDNAPGGRVPPHDDPTTRDARYLNFGGVPSVNTLTMEPGEALGTAAQIAVALAGFAGVVVVFRREGVHAWSGIDKLRLRLLLANSIMPLGISMLGLVLLSVKPPPPGIWRWCSLILLIATFSYVAAITKTFRRLDTREVQRNRSNQFIFLMFGVFGIAALLLQLYNVALLGAFWPFFAAIVYQLITAMAQFARMILLLPE